MTARSNPTICTMVDRLTVWRRHHRDLRELAGLGDAEFSAIAHDLRLSPADFEMLAREGNGQTANLGRLLNALGIDDAAMIRAEPAVVRDMERVCAMCPATARCARDLRAGTSGLTYREYCPNSGTIDALEPARPG
jgi:hypothetical protein